jgi:hypothetical protein
MIDYGVALHNANWPTIQALQVCIDRHRWPVKFGGEGHPVGYGFKIPIAGSLIASRAFAFSRRRGRDFLPYWIRRLRATNRTLNAAFSRCRGRNIQAPLVMQVIAIAAVLTGCATQDPLSNDLLAASLASGGRKSVGVISAIGDTFSMQKVGLTVFGNALDRVPIEPWGIDDFVVKRISAHLSKHFDVRKVDYPKGAFALVDQPKSILSSDYKDYRDQIRDAVRAASTTQKCDLYIVVTKARSTFSNTNQIMSGLGIIDASNFAFTSVFVFALSEIRVYDGHTFTVLGYKRAPVQQQTFMAVVHGPNRQVDQSWWPAAVGLAKDAKLKAATLELLDQSLTTAIAELIPSETAQFKR